MDKSLFENAAKDLLRHLDPDGACAHRPLLVEFHGLSNSGKTTLIDKVYSAYKAAKWTVAKIPEGAEAVLPPRDLPEFNFMTADYSVAKARELRRRRGIHLGLGDRAICDGAVRMQMFADDGTITPEEQRCFEGYFLNRWNRGLYDLHVWLMCRPEVALARKFGADAATMAAHSKTTNADALRKAFDAHQRVWTRLTAGTLAREAHKHVWIDTSDLTLPQALDDVLAAMNAAFAVARGSAPASPEDGAGDFSWK